MKDITQYPSYPLPPAGQIDLQTTIAEKDNIDRIIATLGLNEMSQSKLVSKLCALAQNHPTRKAIFEFDKLIRSIYMLDYIRNPQLRRENRIKAYHQLRARPSRRWAAENS